jgi:hypothetical protein
LPLVAAGAASFNILQYISGHISDENSSKSRARTDIKCEAGSLASFWSNVAYQTKFGGVTGWISAESDGEIIPLACVNQSTRGIDEAAHQLKHCMIQITYSCMTFGWRIANWRFQQPRTITARMNMNTKAAIAFSVTLPLILGTAFLSQVRDADKEFQLIPKERVLEQGTVVPEAEVGTGWSSREDPKEAAQEALDMALIGKKNKRPDFVIIFAAAGSDIRSILLKAREVLGDKTKIYGGSLDSLGVMTYQGFVRAAEKGYGYGSSQRKPAVAVMTVTSEDIVFGADPANCADHRPVEESTKMAMLKTIWSAVKPSSERPK